MKRKPLSATDQMGLPPLGPLPNEPPTPRKTWRDVPTRTQNDGLNDEVSEATRFFCEGESLTRQELEPEANINTILRKFSIDAFGARVPFYGDWDFDRNLQASMALLDSAKKLYDSLPPELHDKFPTVESVITGLENGDLIAEATAGSAARLAGRPPAKAPDRPADNTEPPKPAEQPKTQPAKA